MLILNLIISILVTFLLTTNNCFAMDCVATAYSLEGCEKELTDCGYGITASGEYVRNGIIATDTSIIPMHSLVLVIGDSVCGLYEAKDIGGAIVGKKIDIFMHSTEDCVKFGRKNVRVIVLRKGRFGMDNYGFHKLTDSAIMPKRSTRLSAGYDIFSSEDCVIEPHRHYLVHSGVMVELHCDEVMVLSARSSLHKKGLTLINGVGIIDADYRGEILMPLYNFTDKPVTIEMGDKLTQGVIATYRTFGDKVTEERTGGCGSTGNK